MKTAKEELLDYVKSLTPEQAAKVAGQLPQLVAALERGEGGKE